jgi:pimeloyl-ACP methyl ester carboxylesterase
VALTLQIRPVRVDDADRLVEVPGAGHMLPYEEPDRMAEIILSAALETEGGAS